MDNQPTPAAIIQSAENKAGVIDASLSTMHSQISDMLPLNEASDEAPYEAGLLGTLDRCMMSAGRLQTRLTDLTEKVGLVRP